nr:integrin beta-like protein 1 isoform X5 [Crassostrea gigas]
MTLYCVFIFTVNVALNKPAYIQYPLSWYTWGAESYSRQTATLWVDLTTIHNIHNITIYFRTNNNLQDFYTGLSNNFIGFSVYVSNTTYRLQGTLCYKDDNFTPYTIPAVFTTTCRVHGQYVIYYNERLPGVTYPRGYSTDVSIGLCEVEVYACDKRSFGNNCSESCGHCLDVDKCSNINGTCLTGCEAGFQGELCKTPCQRGFFGENCNNRCLDNCAGCNDVTGMCEYGCLKGYTGYFCENACPYGLFGHKCTSECNDTCTGCNNVNGVCDRGCHPGWRGNYCDIACDKGFYGVDCTDTCGRCRNESHCVHTNGSCLTGCDAGYEGDVCKTRCPYGLFGQDCTGECNENCTGCNNVNGVCDRGCHPGWMGDYCDIGRLACMEYVYVVDMIQLYSYYISIVPFSVISDFKSLMQDRSPTDLLILETGLINFMF